MKHRTLFLILSLALLPLLLASCFWQGPAAPGSIAFSMSAKALSRSITAGADTIRVYLMSGGTLYPIQAAGYDQQALGASYTSPSVPAGTYSLMIAIGKVDSSGNFATTDYADPTSITVSPGVNTPVTVTLNPTPFSNNGLWGQDVTGAALVSNQPFISSETSLYRLTSEAPLALTNLATVPGGVTINSLSPGWEWGDGYSTTPWLNTSQGIVPYSLFSSALVTNFASGAGVANVLDSIGVIPVSDLIAIYERNAGLGGAVVTSGTVGTWYDVDLSQFLSGKPFLDVIQGVDPNNAYFATSLGAFRLDTKIVGQASTTAESVTGAAKFFKVTDSSGNEVPILSLAIFDDPAKGNLLLMGTTKGLYSAVLDEASASVIDGAPTLVAGTEGNSITRIRTVRYFGVSGNQSEAALMSDGNVFLYNGSALTSYPFYSGLPADLPGQLNTLMFVPNGSKMYLVVTGKKGFVILDTGIVVNPG